jgi:hypothetical protein
VEAQFRGEFLAQAKALAAAVVELMLPLHLRLPLEIRFDTVLAEVDKVISQEAILRLAGGLSLSWRGEVPGAVIT